MLSRVGNRCCSPLIPRYLCHVHLRSPPRTEWESYQHLWMYPFSYTVRHIPTTCLPCLSDETLIYTWINNVKQTIRMLGEHTWRVIQAFSSVNEAPFTRTRFHSKPERFCSGSASRLHKAAFETETIWNHQWNCLKPARIWTYPASSVCTKPIHVVSSHKVGCV